MEASASFSSPDNLPTFLKTISLSSLGGARSQEQITFLSGLLVPVNHLQILIGKTWLYKCCPPLICMGAPACFFFLIDLLFYYKIILVVKSSNRDVYKKMISPTLCLWSSVNDLWILHSHTYQHIKHAFGMVVMLYHTYLMMIMKSKLPPWEQPRLILHVSAHRYSVCVLLLAPLQQMIATLFCTWLARYPGILDTMPTSMSF